jgi:ferredoxin
MDTTIYFYTGTGNSLWTAKKLSETLGDTKRIPMTPTGGDVIKSDTKNIGFIFPVHIWGLPARVIHFLQGMENDPAKHYFAVAVNAGQVASTLIQLKNLLHQRGIRLSAGFSLCIPSNYIPWQGADSPEKQQKTFAQALRKIDRITSFVRTQQAMKTEKGPAWQNLFLSTFYRLTFARVPRLDKSFFTDNKCSSCGICENICPARNIEMVQGRPVWRHHCEQCLACLQWCPEEAIQYGSTTVRKKRYHHPEITLKDMLSCLEYKIIEYLFHLSLRSLQRTKNSLAFKKRSDFFCNIS